MKSFRSASIEKEFTLTAELGLQRDSSREDIQRTAEIFRGRVDGLQITDNPLAWINMSVVAASAILLTEGVDPVPMLTCRDRNRVALQSDLLGLKALGVSSILATRGRRVLRQHALHDHTVFDLSGRELIGMAAGLDDGADSNSPAFFIGSGVRVHRAKPGWRAESLQEKAVLGAGFLQSQLCMNTGVLEHYMKSLVEARVVWDFSFIVTVAAFPSAETARWMKQNMPDSRIPESLIKRLQDSADEAQEGIRICAELMQQAVKIPGVSGIHLLSTGNPELDAAAIEESGLAG